MPSGRKQQGKSLLLAVVGEGSPRWQCPRALLSTVLDAKLLWVPVLIRGAFSSCHPVALFKGYQSWGCFLAMGLMAPDVRRWLKFEEDVEDGGERWSKPYVATLSLHSLFELRSCIINGTVLLDVCATSIEEIAGGRCVPAGTAELGSPRCPSLPNQTLPQRRVLFQKSHCVLKL